MVAATVRRAEAAGLGAWAAVEPLTESDLEARLYGPPRTGGRPLPDPLWIHTERQRKGVTLELLHLEYLEQHRDGYRYTQFCEHYRRWCKKRKLSMRQLHRAGEKLFVDYAGQKPHVVNPRTGEEREVELFVAALGASSFTYAEATETQRVADFIGSHTRALEYIGGVPELVIPDQLKSGVTRACRYEPGLQRSYEEWSHHVGTTLLPARPKKPRDKAKVEVAVQVVERWILARLRHETFFSLRDLNVRIAEWLEVLNDRPMRAYGQSRRERFEALDRPALRPLPQEPFELSEW
jgi:transposase